VSAILSPTSFKKEVRRKEEVEIFSSLSFLTQKLRKRLQRFSDQSIGAGIYPDVGKETLHRAWFSGRPRITLPTHSVRRADAVRH
jgi:hypothetical protein